MLIFVQRLNQGFLLYGIVGCIYGAAVGFLLAGIVERIFECFGPSLKKAVVNAADENGVGDMDEEAALSPRGKLPIARMSERKFTACGRWKLELKN
jgi:ABC-type lipoprotein release transport system permease subunit